MNLITITQPPWPTKKVLIASWKVREHNAIAITHHRFPILYYLSGSQIKRYPITKVTTAKGYKATVYVIPINALHKLEVNK